MVCKDNSIGVKYWFPEFPVHNPGTKFISKDSALNIDNWRHLRNSTVDIFTRNPWDRVTGKYNVLWEIDVIDYILDHENFVEIFEIELFNKLMKENFS
jgi:hypothetical protein